MQPFDLTNPPLRQYTHEVWDNSRWEGFDQRPGDILVCTPYKAGTTWTQMICALLIFQRTRFHLPLAEISPWMELHGHEVSKVHATYGAQTHRRFIKTHTPLDGLPWFPEARYICVQRDPRDVFVSMVNQMKNSNPDADTLFAREMSGAEEKAPPDIPTEPNALFAYWLSHGSFAWEEDGAPYWSVLRHGWTFWQHRERENILLTHYADLKCDLPGQMRRIADFLGIEVPEALLPELVKAAQFESMKKNADRMAPDTDMNMWRDNAKFFNKGTSGQWQGLLTPESLALLEDATAKYPADFVDWLMNGAG